MKKFLIYRLPWLVVITAVVLMVGCKQTTGFKQNANTINKNATSDQTTTTTQTSSGEQIVPAAAQTTTSGQTEAAGTPQNITGTFLIGCSIDKYPANTDTSARIGCRLQDSQTGQKASLGASNNAVWQLSPPASANVTVTQKQLVSTSQWHVLFTVSGTTTDIVNNAVNTGGVSAQLNNNNSVSNPMTSALVAGGPVNTSYQITEGKFTRIFSEAQAAPTGGDYICLAIYGGNLNPGRNNPTLDNNCYFSYGTQALSSNQFVYFMADSAATWQPATMSSLPANAVNVGEESNTTPIYACYANLGSQGTQIGKVGASYGGCDIAAGTSWQQATSFSILTR